MLFQARIRVSVASSGAISRNMVFAILQAIALPTELPRRDLNSIRNFAGESQDDRDPRRTPRSSLGRAVSHGVGSHLDAGWRPDRKDDLERGSARLVPRRG